MTAPRAVIERLVRATNAHDVDALVACFSEDYVNETPAHPTRSFRGRDQVRRNWQQIFTAVPDIAAQVHWIVDQHTVWSEWEMRGTRRDGLPHLMRGVIIFGIQSGEAAWARFYLEPVETGGGGVDEAVRRGVGLTTSRATAMDSAPGGLEA